MSDPGLLTLEEAGAQMRVDPETVRRLIKRGELPAYKPAGQYRIAASDVSAYLERTRVPPRDQPDPTT